MKRSVVLTLILALAVALCGALPAGAGEGISLVVNGDPATSFSTRMQEGASMISVADFARLAGVDVAQPAAGTVQISEQGKTLQFTVGKDTAQLDGQPVKLPCPPVSSGDKVFVPLRFTADTFGFTVNWNGESKAVELSRTETRQGMTPTELLVKVNQVMQDVNTYKMQGTMDIKMEALVDGAELEKIPQNMQTTIDGQIQYDPMQMYIKQEIIIPEANEATATETYMTEGKMYIKVPEQGWVMQDLPFAPEFWEQQQNIYNDPLKAVAQMKELGILLNYGNDVEIDGREYYVINATMDMNKFQQGYRKLMEQAMQNVTPNTNQLDPQQLQQLIKQMLDKMTFDYRYTVYVNKDTLVTDIVTFDARVEFDLSNLQELGEQPGDNKVPQEMNIKYDMQGELHISNLGQPFAAPDVSDARPIAELQQQQQQQNN